MCISTKRVLTGAAAAAKQIKTLLSAKYPSVKFSVRSEVFSGGDACRVAWSFGPTVKQVEEITHQFTAGSFNGMEDLYEYNSNRGNDTAKYITESRGYSSAAYAFVEEHICKKIGKEYQAGRMDQVNYYDSNNGYSDTITQIAYRILNRAAFSSDNVEFTGLTYDSSKGHQVEQFYKIEYKDLSAPVAPAKQVKRTEFKEVTATQPTAAPVTGIQAVNYSDRSFMLYGDTFAVKDQLKALGGKFNGFLTHPDTRDKVKGWIFPLTNRNTVLQAIGL